MPIRIKGAREHNLRNISLDLPRDKFIVFTGLSGSGKSSLAFDTIFAEGQRRYVESLSSYARQFLGQMEKPDIDFIEGLSPSISIDQKSSGHNPRSTVGTITEIYDYMRLLFARVGTQFCPICNREIISKTPQEITDEILKLPEKTKFYVLAPIVRGRKGTYEKLFTDYKKKGYVRAVIDENVFELDDVPTLDRYKKHNIDIVIDRLIVSQKIKSRLTDSIETAFEIADDVVTIDLIDKKKSATGEIGNLSSINSIGDGLKYSAKRACPLGHKLELESIEPRAFSFNAPYGACPNCDGLGVKQEVDPTLIVPDDTLSINDGAVIPWKHMTSVYFEAIINETLNSLDIDKNIPFRKIPAKKQKILLYADYYPVHVEYYNRFRRYRSFDTAFEGVVHQIKRRYAESTSDYAKAKYEQFMRDIPCTLCNGARLKDEVLAVKINNKSIFDVANMSIINIKNFFLNVDFGGNKQKIKISTMVLKEIITRLDFLLNVGLEYLTLSRSANTLSGGETQRIRLATQIGSGLMGVLYILDEPSIGLHQKDNAKLIKTLIELKNYGNTLIVVEHDEETIKSADYIVDFGPKAGTQGGKIVYAGDYKNLLKCEKSITGEYLAGKKKIDIPKKRRKSKEFIKVIGAKENNLKNINVKFPLHSFVVVSGVSGSGKSSLIDNILYKTLSAELNGAKKLPGKHKRIEGLENLDKVVYVNQAPIGRTPRSNPATYTGVWDKIRMLFSVTEDAKIRGYKQGRFSFNVRGGRCEACSGDGQIKVEMNFLPDIYVTCEICGGSRYNRETLEVLYNHKNVSDVLNMPISEAYTFFENIPSIKRYLKTLCDVGLGYIKMGQSATTLSGGEAQRVKLATELQKRSNGKTVYILDEPTTGLHFDDVNKLLKVLQGLVDKENTVIVIEHNLDVIKQADYIIDLGPDGGETKGGFIVAKGTPSEIANAKNSYTGAFLKKILKA
jgi:excinuclease ABC subunit A